MILLLALQSSALELVHEPPVSAETTALAGVAFEHGEVCAGRPPDVESVVTLGKLESKRRSGRAMFRDGRLYRIELIGPSPRVVLHEVAHAWSHGRERALDEGGAETLANCIAMRMGRWDLRTVGADRRQDAAQSIDAPDFEGPEYAVARIWYGLLADRVGLPAMLARRDRDDLSFLAGDPAARALFEAHQDPLLVERSRDYDGDGLPDFAEEVLGTDPTVRDSDGDGWWDGARPDAMPSSATHITPDGHLHCSGHRGPEDHADHRDWTVRDRWGTWTGRLETADPRGRVVRGRGVELALWSPDEPGWHADPGCVDGIRAVVLSEASWIPRGLLTAIAERASEVEPSQRTIVRVGTEQTGVVDGEVHISESDTASALGQSARRQLLIVVDALITHAELGSEPTPRRIIDHMRFVLGRDPTWTPTLPGPTSPPG